MKMQVAANNDYTLRTMVRAVANQMPGFLFTNYLSTYTAITATEYGMETLTSMDNIKRMLEN